MRAQEPDFIKEYINWIKDNSAQRFINGYTEITTPFLDSHNDAIQFYVKREGESFLFTDDGYTFADIEMNGLNLNTKKRKELVQYLADSMNVSVENGAITAKASSPTLVAQTEHFMIQAMLKFNDLFYLASPRIRCKFYTEHDMPECEPPSRKCTNEHRQLAEWVKELKNYRKENDWTPCKEKLPEEEGSYLVTDDAGGVKTVQNDEFLHYEDGTPLWLYSQNVTAWRPLPEPYGGEQNDTD